MISPRISPNSLVDVSLVFYVATMMPIHSTSVWSTPTPALDTPKTFDPLLGEELFLYQASKYSKDSSSQSSSLSSSSSSFFHDSSLSSASSINAPMHFYLAKADDIRLRILDKDRALESVDLARIHAPLRILQDEKDVKLGMRVFVRFLISLEDRSDQSQNMVVGLI